MNDAMTDQMKTSSMVLLWCMLLAAARLIFCTQEPL